MYVQLYMYMYGLCGDFVLGKIRDTLLGTKIGPKVPLI